MTWLEIWNKDIPGQEAAHANGAPAESASSPEVAGGNNSRALNKRDEEEIEACNLVNSKRNEAHKKTNSERDVGCQCSCWAMALCGGLDLTTDHHPLCPRANAQSQQEKGRAEEMRLNRRIRIRGINGGIDGKVWESHTVLRAGRLATLEIVLEDTSVSRRHAKVRHTANGWRVRDLGSQQRDLCQW